MKRKYIPSPDKARENTYVTYRRLWLDSALAAYSDDMHGVVVDLGGKRENKRGIFSPPEAQALAWWYINLDMSTKPNLYADVNQTPLKEQSVDCVVCTEVLEHLPYPKKCVDEMHRILRNGGLVLASTPFFYPIHADPFDFQRFTEDGLRHLFGNFKTVEVYRMGGYAGVLGLMFELGRDGLDEASAFQKLLRWKMKWISRWLCRYDLRTFGNEYAAWRRFTTGYFVRAIR